MPAARTVATQVVAKRARKTFTPDVYGEWPEWGLNDPLKQSPPAARRIRPLCAPGLGKGFQSLVRRLRKGDNQPREQIAPVAMGVR